MNDVRVSLVIPAKNAAAVLRPCLDAVVPLLGKDGLDEILLVDDGSTDATAAIAATYPVTVLRSDPKGPGGARNVGWRAARNGLVWFIDSDCVAEPDALQLLVPHLDDPAVAGVGGSYGNLQPDSILACLIHEEIVARHRAMKPEVDYLATFNVVYRRAALEKVGGFDEGNFNGPGAPGAEDIELAFRLHEAGYRLRFDMRSRVGHFHPTRLSRYLRSQRLHGYFRVWLYLHHRDKAVGDAYSGLYDHVQPPLAMLALGSLPLAILAWWWWPAALVPAGLLGLLLLMQLRMALRMVRSTGAARYLWFVPVGFLRAFWRGVGMSWATLRFLLTGRPAPGRPATSTPGG